MKYLLLMLLTAVSLAEEAAPPEERIVLYTNRGELSIALDPAKAPNAVAYFTSLVKNGVYDHTPITFLQKGSYVQVGTVYDRKLPLNPTQRKLIHLVQEETSDASNGFGTVAFTQVEEKPGTAETAFTIFTGDFSNLDGRNTVIGRIDGGQDILRLIETSPTNSRYQPTVTLEIVHAQVMDPSSAQEITTRSQESFLGQERKQASIYAVALILMISVASFFLRTKLSPKIQLSLSMLVAFIAAFTLFFTLTPTVMGSPAVGIVIFASMVGLYKFMNRFESAY